MGRVDALSSQQNKDDSKFTWTDVMDRSIKSSTPIGTVWSFCLFYGDTSFFVFSFHSCPLAEAKLYALS